MLTSRLCTELITANFQALEHGTLLFEYLSSHKQPGKPLMVMEFWTGWFDHWGEKHAVWPTAGMTSAHYVCRHLVNRLATLQAGGTFERLV